MGAASFSPRIVYGRRMQSFEGFRTGPRVRGAGGVEVATYHLGGDGPPVVLVHATGFHGRGWIPLAAELTDEFAVWAVDQRGHGAAGKSPDGRYDNWDVFVDDLMAVLDALGPATGAGPGAWRGVGHSLGGAVLLSLEARRPGTFAGLCCYEPVVIPPVDPSSDGFGEPIPMAHLARKRRSHFPSREAARDNYASKPPLNRFDPAALDAYVTFGFVDDPAGGVTLACTRDDEASVYEGAPSSGVWDLLPVIHPPVSLFGGEELTDPVSRALDRIARQLPRGTYSRIAGLSHFGPFENPSLVGGVVAAALRAPAAVHHHGHTP
jgi:pimeloyl-ACP methyl ester carboxylesterase